MRLDQAVVAAGLCDSRSRAQALIAAGVVTVDGLVVRKASTKVNGETLALAENPIPYVSRAALKLAHALDTFGLHPAGLALDVGASTGGFTQVLLQRGAREVYCLDVGHGQLHPSLVSDPRVHNLEGLNARAMPDGLVPPVDWIVSDVSFISVTKALPGPLSLAKPGGRLVALIKPQFELDPSHIGKGGIVRNESSWALARTNVGTFLTGNGWVVTGEADSPITGGDGNREFLITARKSD